jgi:hypothetical protein
MARLAALSANAAAIQAGFRHKPSPFEILAKAIRKYRADLTADELQQIRDLL